ncbi:MAG: hypothetical protein AB1439_10830 [candidate division FCPU426 bacterium]
MTTEKKLAIVGIVALCGLIVFQIWSHGTTKTINDDPIYGKLVGKTYETRTDLYLSQDRQSANYSIKIPGVLYPEIKEIKEYPHGTAHNIIHKLIPSKTRIKISNVVLTNVPFRGTDLWLKARFEDSSIYEGEVDATFISDFSSYHEKMDSKYVTEITPEGEPVNAK